MENPDTRHEKLDVFLEEIGAMRVNFAEFSPDVEIEEYHAAMEDFVEIIVLRYPSGFEVFTPAADTNNIEETFDAVRDKLKGEA